MENDKTSDDNSEPEDPEVDNSGEGDDSDDAVGDSSDPESNTEGEGKGSEADENESENEDPDVQEEVASDDNGNAWTSGDDSGFKTPVVNGQKVTVPLPESRQHHQDWNHFGGDRSGVPKEKSSHQLAARTQSACGSCSAPSPRDYWDTPVGARYQEPRQSGEFSTPVMHAPTMQPNSRMGRFNAPAPFANDIKQSEKYERWLKWKTTFDVALSICDGIPSDHQKTGLLYTYVGDEVREVIGMLELPPMHGERSFCRGGYIELSSGLNDYFRTLVDESTDFARYSARKQQPGESVHEFAIKLRDLARRVKIAHESIGFRHQFLSGLANRSLATKATEEGMTIGKTIEQAGRIEQALEAEEPRRWMESSHGEASVSIISSKKNWVKKAAAGRAWKRSGAGNGGSFRAKWKQCGTCGRRPHEAGMTCPAVGKSCMNCNGSGHFAAVCKMEPNNTDYSPKEERGSKPSAGGNSGKSQV